MQSLFRGLRRTNMLARPVGLSATCQQGAGANRWDMGALAAALPTSASGGVVCTQTRGMANYRHKKIIKLAKGYRGRANRSTAASRTPHSFPQTRPILGAFASPCRASRRRGSTRTATAR